MSVVQGQGAGEAGASVPPALSLVTVNYRSSELARRLERSCARFMTEADYELIVVDNSDDDAEFEALTAALEGARVRILRAPGNVGFGAGSNLGAAVARAEVLMFVNPDAWLCGSLVDTYLAEFRAASVSGDVVLGGRLRDASGAFQHSGGRFPGPARLLRHIRGCIGRSVRALRGAGPPATPEAPEAPAEPVALDYVTGANLVIARDTFRRLGGFDERYFMFGEEADLQRRLVRAGGRVVYARGLSVLCHENGGTFEANARKRLWLESGTWLFVRAHSRTWPIYWCLLLVYGLTSLLFDRLHDSYELRDDVRFLGAILRMPFVGEQVR